MIYYPKDRAEWLALRHKNVSSTEVAALFGLSPYSTAFELAIKKQAELIDDGDIGERGEWGLTLQNAIARRVAEKYGVKARALNGYSTNALTHTRMGASFDYEIVGLKEGEFEDNSLRDMYSKHGTGVLEIKNVDWMVFKDWQTEDGIEPPAHIELQVQAQLACISRDWAAIGILVGGNRLEMVVRAKDPKVCTLVQDKCEAFWNNLDKGILPPVELPADAAAIAALYRYAEPGKVFDAQENADVTAIVQAYADAGRTAKAANDAKETAKAQLLLAIGDAEKVLVKGFNVSTGVVGETEIAAYTRKGYRNVRITAKKEAKV